MQLSKMFLIWKIGQKTEIFAPSANIIKSSH